MSVCLSVCLYVSLPVCLSVSLYVFLSVCLSALISTISHQQANMQWEVVKEDENRSRRLGSLMDNITMRDFEILSLSQLDKEVEQLMSWRKGSKGRGNIFTSTPVEGEEGQKLEDMEDILKEDKGAESTLARPPGRDRRGRARRWLGRLGGRLLEVVAKVLAAVV